MRPDALHDAARRVLGCADELTEAGQRLDSAELTHEDWGTSWVTDRARGAYQRTHARHQASIRDLAAELRETADRLRVSADRYRQAEQDSTVAG